MIYTKKTTKRGQIMNKLRTNKVELHQETCERLNGIYAKKNHDYGDSFGAGYAEYGMTMAVIRLEDKVRRLKSLLKAEAQVDDESIEDTLIDLANYAIMTLIERQNSEKEDEQDDG